MLSSRLSLGSSRKPWLVAGVLGVVLSLVLAACTTEPESADDEMPDYISTVPEGAESFGYQINSALRTTNAASHIGHATSAQLLSGRLYPAAYVPGPSGQMIPNTDLLNAQPLPSVEPQVIYTISDDARFSDGQPVTCADFLLTATAGAMPELFESHIPLAQQISSVDCQPGSQRFTVNFREDSGARWRELFGPGTVLPAHAIASRAGMNEEELVEALNSQDAGRLKEIAEIWSQGFHLDDFDELLQVSFGPFVIDHVTDAGAVVLARNDFYYGDNAQLDSITVWPDSADSADLVARKAVDIADIGQVEPPWLQRDQSDFNFDVEPKVGDLTDSLNLAETGVFADPEHRRAFAACVDQDAVAAASSQVSGVEVPPVRLHTIEHNDPVRHRIADIGQEFGGLDPQRARGLEGATIRIGYRGPDPRLAAMVEAIAEECGKVGIEVVDVANPDRTVLDTAPEQGSADIDAFLGPIRPASEYEAVSVARSDTKGLREVEEQMWEDLPAIPLAAQPRVFLVSRDVDNVVPYTGESGIGWNMDRWQRTN